MAVGIHRKIARSDDRDLGGCSGNWDFNQCHRTNPLKWLKIDDPVAVGLSLGGTGHAVGTGTAFRYGSVAGAMGGLAIGVTGILYVFVSPIVASLILG